MAKVAAINQEEVKDVVDMLHKKDDRETAEGLQLVVVDPGDANQLVSAETESPKEDETVNIGSSQKQLHQRQLNDSPLLSDLIKVVEHALSLPANSAREKLCRQEFPNILKSNILSKWVQKYYKYELWNLPPSIACKMRQVPNWYIQEQKLDVSQRGPASVAGIPLEVAKLIDRAQAQATMGLTSATKRADAAQGSVHLVSSAKKAMSLYETKCRELALEIDADNKKAWQDFKSTVENAEEPSTEFVAEALTKMKASIKTLPRLGGKTGQGWKPNRMTAARLNAFFGNFRCRTNTAGNFLTYDDPRMENSRLQHANIMAEEEIDPRLVLTLGERSFFV